MTTDLQRLRAVVDELNNKTWIKKGTVPLRKIAPALLDVAEALAEAKAEGLLNYDHFGALVQSDEDLTAAIRKELGE